MSEHNPSMHSCTPLNPSRLLGFACSPKRNGEATSRPSAHSVANGHGGNASAKSIRSRPSMAFTSSPSARAAWHSSVISSASAVSPAHSSTRRRQGRRAARAPTERFVGCLVSHRISSSTPVALPVQFRPSGSCWGEGGGWVGGWVCVCGGWVGAKPGLVGLGGQRAGLGCNAPPVS